MISLRNWSRVSYLRGLYKSSLVLANRSCITVKQWNCITHSPTQLPPITSSRLHCKVRIDLTESSKVQTIQSRSKSYGTGDEISAVEEQLKAMGPENSGIPGIQMALFQAMCKDVSDPTPQLVAKLNGEFEVSAADMYSLAKAVLKAKDSVADGSFLMAISGALFGCSGEMGNTDAYFTYAQLLFRGHGVEKDQSKAAKVYENLATKGHPFAQFCLGSMYYFGQGVEQNFKTAYSLFKVSAQNHVPQAFSMLGNLHRRGEGVDKDLKLAVEYYKQGIEYDDRSAHVNLAHCYTNGEGVKKSPEKAFKHYLVACQANDPMCLYNVGVAYLSGIGVEQDLVKAREYLEKASVIGFFPAQLNLGNMYYNGVGVQKDVAKAKELFRLAADQDEACANYLRAVEEEEKKQK